MSVLDIGASISSILSLAGFACACIFLIIRIILQNKPGNTTVKLVVNWIFVIATIGMVLGFAGWTISQTKNGGEALAKTTLSFNIFDEANRKKPLENVTVFANEGRTVSSSAGYVSLSFDTPSSDSVHVVFLSSNLGVSDDKKVSLKHCPSELYVEVRTNGITKRSKEIIKNNESKNQINRRAINLDSHHPAKNNTLALTIKSLLYKVPFNSSLNDILSYEFGASHPSIEYDNLPVAIECSPTMIRYYWRYLHDSKLKEEVYSFLRSKGLMDLISDGTYLVYGFKDNKLVRINIRFFTTTQDFNKGLIRALLNNNNYNESEYLTANVNDFYYATGSSYKDIQSFEILMSNEEGFNACIHDWWHK